MEPSETQIQLGKLSPSCTALFLCDLQEKLLPAMLYKLEILKNAKKLVQGLLTPIKKKLDLLLFVIYYSRLKQQKL